MPLPEEPLPVEEDVGPPVDAEAPAPHVLDDPLCPPVLAAGALDVEPVPHWLEACGAVALPLAPLPDVDAEAPDPPPVVAETLSRLGDRRACGVVVAAGAAALAEPAPPGRAERDWWWVAGRDGVT